jgi:hypothetical protein
MTTVAHQPNANRTRGEHVALDRLVTRLIRQFPDLPAGQVERAVHSEYERYADSRVRNYVLILVARAVRVRLADARDGRPGQRPTRRMENR